MTYLKRIWQFIKQKIGPKRLRYFDDIKIVSSSKKAQLGMVPGVLILVGEQNNYKWLKFICPCGCGELQALNLMKSHYPHWSVEINPNKRLTVYPSVHAQKCGAHFWIRNNKIYWC